MNSHYFRTTNSWIAAIGLCICSTSWSQQSLDPEDRRLIDKMIAVSDQNFQLLSEGTADYYVSYHDRVSGQRNDEKVHLSVAADGRIRKDTQSEVPGANVRELLVGDRLYQFDPSAIAGIRNGDPPDDYNAFVYPSSNYKRDVFLSDQGIPQRKEGGKSLGDWLRYILDSEITLEVVKKIVSQKEVVELTFFPDDGLSVRLTVLPSRAFGIVDYQMSTVRLPLPVTEATNRFRQLPNSAFIAESGTRIIRSWRDGNLEFDQIATFRLNNVDLSPPPEDIFTLEGLGIPPGVILADRITYKDYAYGIFPVTESDFEIPQVYGSDFSRWVPFVTICAAVTLALIWVTRRWLRDSKK